jgi:hypothetical protein
MLIGGCGPGAGIYNEGTLTVTNSTVSGNSAGGDGGGIRNDGGPTLINSTVSGNSAGVGSTVMASRGVRSEVALTHPR